MHKGLSCADQVAKPVGATQLSLALAMRLPTDNNRAYGNRKTSVAERIISLSLDRQRSGAYSWSSGAYRLRFVVW